MRNQLKETQNVLAPAPVSKKQYRYMIGRPYSEVAELIPLLQNLKVYTEEKTNEQEETGTVKPKAD